MEKGTGSLIRFLHAENFRVLSGVRDYEFPEGIVGIVGPNGQGKSTLINSIAWALYGQEALPLRARDPITWGQKECLVRAHLVLNDGQEWIIERTQKTSGVGRAKLYVLGQEDTPKANGSAPTTAAVAELMGVDREGFLISVFARQFELDRLRSMDPSPRMQTVLRLLGINQITKAVKLVREDGNEQKKSLDVLRGRQIDTEATEGELAALRSELSEMTTQAVTARGKLVEANEAMEALHAERTKLEPKRKAYLSYLNDLQAKKTTLLLCNTTYDQAHKDVNQPEPQKPEPPEYKEVKHVSEEEVTNSKNVYLKLRDDWTVLNSRRSTAERQLNDLKDTCPTCNRPFDDAAHIERERERIRRQIENYATSMSVCAKLGEEAKAEWETEGRNKVESDYLIGLNSRLKDGYENQLRNYETISAHLEQARERFLTAQRALQAAQEALESLKPVDDVSQREQVLQLNIDAVGLKITSESQTLATAEAEQRAIEADIERLNNQLLSVQKDQKEIKSIEKIVVQHDTTADELQKLKEAMIGGIIPSLNERASSLVEMMTDGKYSELALTSDYEIEYRNHLGEYKNFLNLSGGEQTVFALALRLAISDLRAGNLGVLFLDEAISNLSSEDGRQESVWQAIESLTSRFKQTFVITHVEAYKDRAPYTVRL